MMLSTEQTRAVTHGIDNRLTWREIERPVGPQPTPDWCKGAHVRWREGCSNSPDVLLKVHGNVRDWPDKRFACEGSRYYRARHEDGRMEQYAHDGAIRLDKVRMFQSADGTIRRHRRSGPQWPPANGGFGWIENGQRIGHEPGEWIDVERMCTTRQEGFGGEHYHLTMEDGSTLVLRGPWHVGAPAGYAEVAFIDVDRYPPTNGRPWHATGGTGGLYLRHDTFVAIMARFCPELPLAEVTYGGATTIEPMKPEWGEPKRLVYEREWLARKAEREARS